MDSGCFDFDLDSSDFIDGKLGVRGLDGIPSLESDSIAGESSIFAESESLYAASIWSFLTTLAVAGCSLVLGVGGLVFLAVLSSSDDVPKRLALFSFCPNKDFSFMPSSLFFFLSRF